ncbi:hypothetical protein Egran_03343 [Elaphomyces granulatus]|uniref:Phosphotyrosine protein phosphatase I domain-containing protein n=1 Tax=Elaphomyces granulatus TaxID=519963 RepID=A0A232LXJ7_9EURO|nr:hypothetical protein Egran_03343 [Elaphomyces granulatus]
MAEAVFRSAVTSSPTLLIGDIDSAGTASYHTPEPPNPRTMSTLHRHGITDYEHAARTVTKEDFRTFDYILAMDGNNLRDLLRARNSVLTIEKKGGSSRAASNVSDYSVGPIGSSSSEEKIAEVRLFGDFGPGGTIQSRVGGGEEVQDPYYGSAQDYEEVYEQMVRFSKAFLAYLETERKAGVAEESYN